MSVGDCSNRMELVIPEEATYTVLVVVSRSSSYMSWKDQCWNLKLFTAILAIYSETTILTATPTATAQKS